MKLEKLSEEQEKLMLQVRDEWIDLALKENTNGINKKMFEEGVEWLYKDLLNKPNPKVIYCDSWLSCLITIAILKNSSSVRASVVDSVSESVRASVEESVRESVCGNVWDSVKYSVWDSVRDSVWDSVWGSVRDSVWDSFWGSVRDFSSYIGYSNYGWVSFYDFFEKINLLNNFKFKQYKKLIKSNCFNAYEYENYVFAIQPPIVISKNSLGRLHDVNKASVIFKDGSEYFYIQGRNIPKELFEKLKSGNYLISDFIKENNEEIKSACIAYLQEVNGDNYLINFFRQNLKEIDTYVDRKEFQYLEGTTKGMNIGVYTLFKGVINNVNIAYVRCYCPSTDRMFFLGVSSEYNNAKDAISSLCRIPKKMKPHLKHLMRQGERVSSTYTKKGWEVFKELSKSDIEDLVPLTGEEYFNKMTYEY